MTSRSCSTARSSTAGRSPAAARTPNAAGSASASLSPRAACRPVPGGITAGRAKLRSARRDSVALLDPAAVAGVGGRESTDQLVAQAGERHDGVDDELTRQPVQVDVGLVL